MFGEDKWMPRQRYSTQFVTLGARIYMFGGMSDQTMADMHYLTPISWKWQVAKYSHGIRDIVPMERHSHSANAIPGTSKILIFGGYKRYNEVFKMRECYGDVLLFDTQTMCWD
jgi:Rab9 effector protein with kelch motifs